jgi:hypothetical protein
LEHKDAIELKAITETSLCCGIYEEFKGFLEIKNEKK